MLTQLETAESEKKNAAQEFQRNEGMLVAEQLQCSLSKRKLWIERLLRQIEDANNQTASIRKSLATLQSENKDLLGVSFVCV